MSELFAAPEGAQKMDLPELEQAVPDEPIGVAEFGDLGEFARQAAEAIETQTALGLIQAEMDRQTAKFGVQDLPVYNSAEPRGEARKRYAELAARHKANNDFRATVGTLSWDGILFEEVFEALAEDSELSAEAYETELIQVAAVAIRLWMANRRGRRTDREAIAMYLGSLGFSPSSPEGL